MIYDRSKFFTEFHYISINIFYDIFMYDLNGGTAEKNIIKAISAYELAASLYA